MTNQEAFLVGRIHAMKLRLEKAQRRIERSNNPTEAERAHRLGKLIWLHENQPEEAIKLYNKFVPAVLQTLSNIPDYTTD
jgi:hypothetical protein